MTEEESISSSLMPVQEDLLRSILETLPGAVFVGDWTEEGGYDYASAYASESTSRFTGLSPEEQLSRPGSLLALVHPDDRSAMVEAFERAAREQVEVEVTYRIRNAVTGDTSRVLERVRGMPDPKTGRTRIVGFMMDVTSQLEAQEELRRSKQRMQVLVEGTPYLFFYTQDDDGNVTYVSPSVEEITGYSVKEWLGQSHWFITDNEINDSARMATRAHLRGADPQGAHVIEIFRKDRKRILLEVFEHPIIRKGEVEGIQGVAHDVTEQVRLQEALVESRKMEAVGRLAAGLAHDFNNMLQGIIMSAELAAGAVEQDRPRKWLKEILSLSGRGRDLIRQLLAYSRRQVLQPEAADLNDVLREAAPLIQRLVGDDVSVRFDLEAEVPPVSADTSQLMQVLLNLAANARDAMPTGGELRLRTLVAPDGHTPGEGGSGTAVQLKVSDTGTGIAPESVPMIFEPYFTTKRSEGGTGLGLASVMGVVRQHHGTIRVSSTVGAGTTFTITLPAVGGLIESGPKVPVTEQQAPRGSETILLVEDHVEVRQALAEVLASLGYRVHSAESVASGRAVASREAIDLLLTDLQLPDGTGLELIEPLRKRSPGLPVVLLSGYARGSLPGMLDRLPPDVEFLEKPVNASTLATALHKALGGV